VNVHPVTMETDANISTTATVTAARTERTVLMEKTHISACAVSTIQVGRLDIKYHAL